MLNIFKHFDYDIVIVGGGSAGLFGAFRIQNLLPKGIKVLLLEKTGSLGNKLCLSGNGQCNYTNATDMINFQNRYGEKGKFLKKALSQLSNNSLIEMFQSYGLDSIIRDDGKVFPKSLKAVDIRNLLIEVAKQYPVEIKLNSEVINIDYKPDSIILEISHFKEKINITTKYLILCTGGASFTKTGSTGDILRLLKKYQILTHPFKPALAVPKVKLLYKESFSTNDFSSLSGITLKNARLSIQKKGIGLIRLPDSQGNLRYPDESRVNPTLPHRRRAKNLNIDMTTNGALLFTHTGLSGPLILDNSRYCEVGDKIRIYLTQFDRVNELEEYVLELIEQFPKRKMANILNQLDIPSRLLDFLLGDEFTEIKAAELSKMNRKKICNKLHYVEFLIVGIDDIENAMCSKGGVEVSELHRSSMMLKKLPNIFLAGECIDIDGDTGGYNIHAAFATINLIVLNLQKLIVNPARIRTKWRKKI